MNTIMTIASANASILAVDLGKYKSVACVHDPATGEFRFTTFDTTRAELQRLLDKQSPAVVIIEACLLAGWVHDLCAELGVCCLVANTASEAWKFKHLKRKTDRDDALRLAQLHLLGQLPTVCLPPSSIRQWRFLIACRQTLVGRRIAAQNRIRALFVAQGLPAPRGQGVGRRRPSRNRELGETAGRMRSRGTVARFARTGPGGGVEGSARAVMLSRSRLRPVDTQVQGRLRVGARIAGAMPSQRR